MADENPTDGKRAVPVALPAALVRRLRNNLEACLEGVRGDLLGPHTRPNSERSRREAKAYERLLAGLRHGAVIVPDEEARKAIKAMADAADEHFEYAAAVAEHDALHGLLALLTV
jgi:hypothetical protein